MVVLILGYALDDHPQLEHSGQSVGASTRVNHHDFCDFFFQIK